MPGILPSVHSLPKVRATHPDCSVVLYFQEQEAECLEIIKSESRNPAPPTAHGQQGERSPPHTQAHFPRDKGEDVLWGALDESLWQRGCSILAEPRNVLLQGNGG